MLADPLGRGVDISRPTCCEAEWDISRLTGSEGIWYMLADPLGRGVDISQPTRWEGGWIYPGRPVLKAYDISRRTCWEGVWIYLGCSPFSQDIPLSNGPIKND